MNVTASILPKTISSTTHSARSSFKLQNQQPTQKLVIPFVKLEHLFPKQQKGRQHHHKFSKTQTSLHKKNNISYINLGIDEQQSTMEAIPKGTFPNRLKLKQIRTDRNDQSILNTTCNEKQNKKKRHRHQSLVNIVKQYTLFAPNREKDNLQKFQKKLIDSLNKKETSEKISQLQTTHGLRFISYFKTQQVIDSLGSRPKEQQSVDSSEKRMDKWKLLALKYKNSQNLPFNTYALNTLNTTQPIEKSRKKLSRRYAKQNTTLNTIYPLFSGEQNSQFRKSKIIEMGQQKENNALQMEEKPQSSFFSKNKFKLAKFIKTHELTTPQDQQGLKLQKWQSSKNKLKKLLKCRQNCATKEKGLVLTPWDWVPSEKEIELNYEGQQ